SSGETEPDRTTPTISSTGASRDRRAASDPRGSGRLPTAKTQDILGTGQVTFTKKPPKMEAGRPPGTGPRQRLPRLQTGASGPGRALASDRPGMVVIPCDGRPITGGSGSTDVHLPR